MWMQYPQTESLFAIDDQYLIGSDLLVKPVTAPGVSETSVKFPSDDVWYDAESLIAISVLGAPGTFKEITVPSDIDTIPVFQRGGSIITRKLRLRRSSHMMTNDPYTLYVAMDSSMKAEGALYMDDEVTFNHERNAEFVMATFTADFSRSVSIIENTVTVGDGWKTAVEEIAHSRLVERIVVMGLQKPPSNIDIGGETLGFTYDSKAKVLVIRKPEVSAMKDWEMKITY
jgi:alpha 1,3-glucosidase